MLGVRSSWRPYLTPCVRYRNRRRENVPHARRPASLAAPPAAEPRPDDGTRTRRRAGCLRAHRLPGHRGAQRRGRSRARRPRPGGRLPPAGRVPHPAHRTDRLRGGLPLPFRTPGPGAGTGARSRAGDRAAQGARRAPRTARRAQPAGPGPVPPGRARLVPGPGPGAVPADGRPLRVGAAGAAGALPALARRGTAHAAPAGHRPQGRHLVRGGGDRRAGHRAGHRAGRGAGRRAGGRGQGGSPRSGTRGRRKPGPGHRGRRHSRRGRFAGERAHLPDLPAAGGRTRRRGLRAACGLRPGRLLGGVGPPAGGAAPPVHRPGPALPRGSAAAPGEVRRIR